MDLVRRKHDASAVNPRTLYVRERRARLRRTAFIKRCNCWKSHCKACMRAFQGRLAVLDAMIRKGWGETSQTAIPSRWRTENGPGNKGSRGELVKRTVAQIP
jgi:hypothetical protein